MISRRRWLVMSVCVVVWLACPRAAAAATCVWIGGGLTAEWSDLANWNCNGAFAIPQNNDTIRFPAGAPLTTNHNDLTGLRLHSIFIDGDGAGDTPYLITGGFVIVTNQVQIQGGAGNSGPSFLAPIVTDTTFVIISHLGSGLATLGQINLNAGALSVQAVGGPMVINGPLVGNVSQALVKSGSFNVALAGNNEAYHGIIQVLAGNLDVQTATALGAHEHDIGVRHTEIFHDASVTISPGLTVDESFLLKESPSQISSATLRVPSGTATLTGAIRDDFCNVVFEIGGAATLTVSGDIRLPFDNVTKTGAGTLVLANTDNDWLQTFLMEGTVRVGVTGGFPDRPSVKTWPGTVIDLNNLIEQVGELFDISGTIQLGSGTLVIAQDHFGTIDGAIVGTGNVVQNGPAFMRLEGPTANTYTGQTMVSGGNFQLAKTGGAPAISGNVLLTGSGALQWLASNQVADSATITVNASGALNVGAHDETIAVLTGSSGIGGLTFDGTFTVGGTHETMVYMGFLRGGGVLRKEGRGRLVLTRVNATSGPNAFLGRADVAGGTLQVMGSVPGTLLIGGVLTGTGDAGTVVAAVPFGGGVSPGTGPGILTTSSMALASGTTFTAELNGPFAGPGGHDRLVAAGGVGLSGATLNATLGFAPTPGTTLTIIDVGVGPVEGTFAGLPENASLMIGGRPFRITYTGGDGNDVVLTALTAPEISISDVTVTEGHAGSINAEFTVSLSTAAVEHVTVQYATVNGTAVSPQDYAPQSGTLTFTPGQQSKTVSIAVIGDTHIEPAETFTVHLSNALGGGATIVDADGAGTITNDDTTLTWYLAEGATGVFFDNDLLIANPTTTAAPVTLTFFPEGGSPIVDQRTIPAQSRMTIHVDQLPGLENASAAVQVTSTDAVPLVVERTMFWDATYYGGHTGAAVTAASPTWFFAEASQGFFDTFVLITNANDTAAQVTLTFLREGEPPVVKSVPVGAQSRVTIGAGGFSELVGRSFGLSVDATLPVIAERAMYFGTTSAHLWSGGHESPGVTQTSTNWFIAEGATGSFFDTYILLSNPSDDDAQVTLDFLPEDGATVRVLRTVPAKARVTVDVEGQDDPRLKAGAVSTVVTSDRPIVAERSTYWAGDATPWGEGHNSFGLTETSPTWGLAEGRVGGAHNFVTFILLANPQSTAAEVTVTYLRETGAPIVKTYMLQPASRFTIGVNSDVPELHDETFGARIDVTNGVPIAVERSMYWDANGVFWAGGSHAPATRLP